MIIGTGLLAGPQLAKSINTLNGVVNVKDFGAVGDGVVNDTAAIQAAINYACSLQSSTLLFPPGIYSTEGSLTILAGRVHIKGESAELVHNTSEGVPVILIDEAEVHIEGLTVDGKKSLKPPIQTTGNAIRFQKVKRCSVFNCNIKNTHEHGINVVATDDVTQETTENVTITNNYFEGVGNEDTGRGYAVWCFGYVNHICISNNIVKDSVGGLSVDDASSSGPIRDSKDVVISNNLCECYTACIRYESSYRAAITGNVANIIRTSTTVPPMVDRNAAFLIRAIQTSVDPVDQVSIVGNVMRGPRHGLFLQSARHISCSGNVIELTNAGAMDFGAETGRAAVFIEKTTANNTSRPTDHILITANQIIAHGFGIIVGATSTITIDQITIQGNHILCTKESPQSGQDWGVFLENCAGVAVLDNDVHLFRTGIRVAGANSGDVKPILIKGNISHNNVIDGIYLEGAARHIVRDNITYGNGSRGINVAQSAQNFQSEFSGNYSEDTDVSNLAFLREGRFSSGYGNTGTVAAISSATDTQIAGAASEINTIRKSMGKVIFDRTNNRLMVAAGRNDVDPWHVVDGSASVTPAVPSP